MVKIVIELEIEITSTDNMSTFQSRWINNKVTAQVADLVEKTAICAVTKVDVRTA